MILFQFCCVYIIVLSQIRPVLLSSYTHFTIFYLPMITLFNATYYPLEISLSRLKNPYNLRHNHSVVGAENTSLLSSLYRDKRKGIRSWIFTTKRWFESSVTSSVQQKSSGLKFRTSVSGCDVPQSRHYNSISSYFSPYLSIRGVFLSSIHYSHSRRIFINQSTNTFAEFEVETYTNVH